MRFQPLRFDPPTTLEDLLEWAKTLAQNLQRQQVVLQQILSGNVEWPTPFDNERQTANLLCNFKQLWLSQPDPLQTPAIAVVHGLDRIPRFWFVTQVQLAGGAIQEIHILDQIVSSQWPNPLNLAASYPTASVDPLDNRIIIGGAAVAGGWVDNDVRVGDEIQLRAAISPAASTASVTIGSNRVTRVTGAGFKSFLKIGWPFWFPAAAGAKEQAQREITNVVSDNIIEVSDRYETAVPAQAWSYQPFDVPFRLIKSITADPGGDIIILDNRLPGTDVPRGTLLCDYVIRRPADKQIMWVRVLAPDPEDIDLTLAIV